MKTLGVLTAAACALILAGCASLSSHPPKPVEPPPPLKALFLTGGGYHDYARLAPFLTNSLGQRVNVTFDVDFTMDRLTNANFAKKYDVVVYDLCFDEAPPEELSNALDTIRAGKPAVMIHCAVHAFRRVKPMIREWERGVGMRSKVHDRFEPFQVTKLDPTSPITAAWPEDWRTGGDELYQTIEFLPDSHALLSAKSPVDGRVHIVCWTQNYGSGRVFATTLGHDMTTAQDQDYQQLLARGLLWAVDKLAADGKAASGYSKD